MGAGRTEPLKTFIIYPLPEPIWFQRLEGPTMGGNRLD